MHEKQQGRGSFAGLSVGEAENRSDVISQAAVGENTQILERPFHFTVVVWGERFRNYFLEYCLPSLLSPNNIPSLSTRQPSRFVIATYPEDWDAIRRTAIFQAMERYLLPTYLEIPPCPPDRSACEHMGIGHKKICNLAHAEKAYAMILTPDCMVSDGTVSRLQELALGGTELVLAAALRFGEEPFLDRLGSIGVLPSVSPRDTGNPLTVTGPQMVLAAIDGFHSQTLSYEWESPHLCAIQPAAWWRVPGEKGILVHSLSWAPLLLDYAAIGEHDTSTLDNWTIDADYVYKNIDGSRLIHVVQDSDEIFFASWAPLDDRPVDTGTSNLFSRWYSRRLKTLFFRKSFLSPVFDPLKRRIFHLPVRWHADPLNPNWIAVENAAAAVVREIVNPDNNTDRYRLRLRVLAYLTEFANIASLLKSTWPRHRRTIGLALLGDREACKRLAKGLRYLTHRLVFPSPL